MALVTACANLGSSEKEFLNEIQSLGVQSDDQQVKSPPMAGALNLLPGFGNFYLAYGTTESEQWMVGGLNLLTWPLSVLWGVLEGVVDAVTINKKATAYYYRYDRTGKTKLAMLRRTQNQYSARQSQGANGGPPQVAKWSPPAGAWATVSNDTKAYVGAGGTGQSGVMPSDVKLTLIEYRGAWGSYEYASVKGENARAWLRQSDVRPR